MIVRAVVQRVSRAVVAVEGDAVGDIGAGLMILLGVAEGDTGADAAALADKVVGLRIFADDEGKMNRSVGEVGGEVLVVSQFTLLADIRKGRRPSFVGAARPDEAARMVDLVVARIGEAGVECATGVFGAHMQVELVNDGPVTIVIETAAGRVV